ncbi:hypothetical protein RvY_16924-2 [Ramazzottius varieornatus]|uniref:Uncharacterized protein n=1 Tax=Ramazzottius varieornatus TaxID=947166 RepID=A0A1D1W187_RAMVA|nr:hypothetical protein RvY_16924-2 [Ramazzottius varieornatus]
MTERHNYSDELVGKTEQEKGIHVRAKWDANYQISKAIIIEVDSDEMKVNALFDTLEGIRQSEKEKKNKPAQRSQRMTNLDRTESERNKRNELNNQRLFSSGIRGNRQDHKGGGEDEGSDKDEGPGPITKIVGRRRLKMPLRKGTKRTRSTLESSGESSLSSRPSSGADRDARKTYNVDSEDGKSDIAEFQDYVNEQEWSENDWARGPEGK